MLKLNPLCASAILFFLFQACLCHAEVSDDLKKETFSMDEIAVNKLYPAMTGPTVQKNIKLRSSPGSSSVWIKGMSIKVINAQGKEESISYVCHAWAFLFDRHKHHWVWSLTLSEGMEGMQFPDGFALKTPSNISLCLLAQLKNEEEHIHKNLTFKITLSYLEDADAKRLKLRPLEFVTVNTKADSSDDYPDGICRFKNLYDMFMVPPGRHVYRSVIPAGSSFYHDGIIHFMRIHLHNYGESVELFDKTAQKTVWKGMAQMSPDNTFIKSTDYYSSTEGLRIFKSHDYEVITTYNNTTSRPVDAMGILRVYFELI